VTRRSAVRSLKPGSLGMDFRPDRPQKWRDAALDLRSATCQALHVTAPRPKLTRQVPQGKARSAIARLQIVEREGRTRGRRITGGPALACRLGTAAKPGSRQVRDSVPLKVFADRRAVERPGSSPRPRDRLIRAGEETRRHGSRCHTRRTRRQSVAGRRHDASGALRESPARSDPPRTTHAPD